MAERPLDGRTALVTGAGSGIGAAVARRLVHAGATVVVLDRDLAAAERTAAELGPAGHALAADVADEAAIEAAVARAAAVHGRLDIAVNAAGVGFSAALVDQSLADWQRVQEVNLTGAFVCCKHEARQMLRQGGGVIVNIASTNALQPGEGLAAYCASKAGVAMLTRVAAMELAPHGIRVVGVGPGLTETPLVARLLARPEARQEFLANIPAGRPAKPEDIAAVVAFLASDDAAYINGDTIYVDGGALTQRYPSLAARAPSPAPAAAAP